MDVCRGGTRVTLKATDIVSGTTPTLLVRVVINSDPGSTYDDKVSLPLFYVNKCKKTAVYTHC